jgi:hypothetical protein
MELHSSTRRYDPIGFQQLFFLRNSVKCTMKLVGLQFKHRNFPVKIAVDIHNKSTNYKIHSLLFFFYFCIISVVSVIKYI